MPKFSFYLRILGARCFWKLLCFGSSELEVLLLMAAVLVQICVLFLSIIWRLLMTTSQKCNAMLLLAPSQVQDILATAV